MAKIHPSANMSLQASAGILVCSELGKEIFKEFFDRNCAAAAVNILIAASNLGLGAIEIDLYPNKSHIENFRNYFQLPMQIIPFTWIPRGHPKNPTKSNNRLDSSLVKILLSHSRFVGDFLGSPFL
jgi:hypothetical protein